MARAAGGTRSPALSTSRQQFADERFFLFQLIYRGVDFRAAEFIQRNTLHDFERSVAADRERADQPFLNSVAAVGANTPAVSLPPLTWHLGGCSLPSPRRG